MQILNTTTNNTDYVRQTSYFTHLDNINLHKQEQQPVAVRPGNANFISIH